MSGNNLHPYWGQAIQYQARHQGQHQQRGQQQRQQPRPSPPSRQLVRDDYGNEWMDKEVEARVIEGSNVMVVRGKIIDTARYWLKVSVGGQILYLNKAFIISIKLAEMKNDPGVEGNENRQSC